MTPSRSAPNPGDPGRGGPESVPPPGPASPAWRRWPELLLGGLLAATIFLMMVVTFVDVVGRYFFNAPLPAADELTKLAMGVSIFAGLPLVTAGREHITISLLDGLMGSRLRRRRDTAVDLVSLAAVAVLAWRLWRQGNELVRYGDATLFLRVPLAPFAYFMALMALLAAAVLLARIAGRARPEPPSGDG